MMQMFSGASSGGWFEKAQRFGKSFMLPIAVLPAAGLLLGIGGALSNPNTLTAYPFLDADWLQAIFTIMTSAGSIVFANLSVLFAVGVAVGLAKSDKGTAGLASLLAFLVMNATINALLTLNGTLAQEPRFSWPGDDAWYSDTGNWCVWWGGDWSRHLHFT